MKEHFDSELPSVEHLMKRAKKRMPGFAYDYLAGGCFTEVNLKRNTSDIREIQLKPWYLRDYACLLYTSPSPRDATLSRMPSSA